jgi:homoserine kinase
MFTSGEAAMVSTSLRTDGRAGAADMLPTMSAAVSAVPGRGAASAPASSANLGPGFDVVALALALRCRVSVAPATVWSLQSEETDRHSLALVRRAAESAVPGSGPFAVTVAGRIPVGRGLGASAALVAGLVAAVRAAAGLPESREEVLLVGTGVEGHPDNVAAAVYGGAVAVSAGGRVCGLEVHPSLRVLVAIPQAVLPTRVARAALADPVDTATAARTAARIAFLVEGLRRGDPGLLAEAAGDELHEKRRAHLSPLTGRLVAAAREAGAAHAAWSGAGPSALALVSGETVEAVRAAWMETLAGEGGTVLEPGLDRVGLRVGLGT